MLLRWYDTRILPVWLNVLTPAQRAGFIGPIQSWHYFDRFGQQQTIPCAISNASTASPATVPLQLSQAQYDTLLSASEPDMVIAQLRRIIPGEIKRVPYATLYPFVEHHTHSARQYGAATLDEQVQHVLVALYTSGSNIEHESFKLRKTHVDQSLDVPALDDWLQTLPDDIWEAGKPLWEKENTQ